MSSTNFIKIVRKLELDSLITLADKDIVPTFTYTSMENGKFKVVMEKYPATLADYIEENNIKDLSDLGNIADKVIFLINQIHSLGIIHGDFHTRNIVLDPESREVRIIDFCESTPIDKVDNSILAYYTTYWPKELPPSSTIEQLKQNEAKMWELDYFV